MSADHAVLLVGHGVPATDAPRELVTRFKALEGRRRASGAPPSDEERDVDRQLREWPRTDANDPYRAGMQKVAQALARRLGVDEVVLAYNEFCAPSVEDAVRALARDGARDIRVVPTMLTPGGVHAEVEIPESLEALSAELPHVTLRYAWPFDLDDAAELFARQLERL
jgi:sirohydrochlorin cobaltochelatase